MRCLRTILGVSLRDHIRNERIRKLLNINSTIIDIIRKKRLQWFGHITRQPDSHFTRTVYKQEFKGKRPRGRQPKQCSDQNGHWSSPSNS